MTNRADPIKWALKKPSDLDLYCFQRKHKQKFSKTETHGCEEKHRSLAKSA